ncbi:uncharacterized protein LOC131634432 [Vicia villosa]|uniref:uncharacterized protein LOC131634432 n=1 Tax=Vicia villosa TaxID=3911 RepID=UPI00273BBD05|nr:uncharacterized protein LOC131634432 [Vicia villosa]
MGCVVGRVVGTEFGTGCIVGRVEEEDEHETEVDDMVNGESEDEQHISVPPDHVYEPPAHMTNLNLQGDEPSSDIFFNPYIQSDEVLKTRDKFPSKEACLRTIKKWHMARNVDFTVDRSNLERYIIIYKNHDGAFRLCASYRKRSDAWVIGSISQQHTCVNSNMCQDHTKLSYDLIYQEILPLINGDPSLKVKTIISHIVIAYNYTPSYIKAWIAKTKVIQIVYGNWEGSFKKLPRYLTTLQTYAPDTVSILETLPAHALDGTRVQGNEIFHRLFWAFQPCIRGFSYCKPILQIDGTWLCGKYKGTMLMVVAQDGNNNIFRVAFAIVEGETAAGWSFFLRNLRKYVAPQPDLCLISNRHASIESAYNNSDNGWQHPSSTHVYCIRHIAQHFMREIKDRHLRKTLVNAGYTLTQPTFQHYQSEIVMSNPDAGSWIDNLSREKWTRAYDNSVRWGHMTTILVESMNDVFKGIQKLPFTALVEVTYFRMASLFSSRGQRWCVVKESGQMFCESCMKFLKEQSSKANNHDVTAFDRFNRTFSVR